MVKEQLPAHKYSSKFVGTLHDVANEFVRFVADHANKETMRKNKSKIVAEDIFVVLKGQAGFTDAELAVFREKTAEFEKSESVS